MLNELADILAVSWYLSLKRIFPNKEFTLYVSKREEEFPIVTCSQFPEWCKEFYSGVREGSDGVKMMPTLPFIPKMAEEMGDTHHAHLLLDDISDACALEEILLFSPILFPTFIVREGAVFLQFLYSEEKFNKLRQEMSLHHLEEAMNHLSLKDFFRGCQNLSGKLFNEMAEMLAFSWRLSLKEKFPNKEFTVCVSKGEDSSPMISFSQSEGANYENEFTPYDADYWNGKWRRDKEISCSWQEKWES